MSAATVGQTQEGRDTSVASEQAFHKLAAVLTHPRCLNCHVRGDHPRTGERGQRHQPPVARGPKGSGAPGLPCVACHGRQNFDPGLTPGGPKWKLAPRSAGWDGLTVAEMCRALKDRRMNGGKGPRALLKHMRSDPLVLWGWKPGAGRAPVAMPYEEFVALFEYWLNTGAACPPA